MKDLVVMSMIKLFRNRLKLISNSIMFWNVIMVVLQIITVVLVEPWKFEPDEFHFALVILIIGQCLASFVCLFRELDRENDTEVMIIWVNALPALVVSICGFIISFIIDLVWWPGASIGKSISHFNKWLDGERKRH